MRFSISAISLVLLLSTQPARSTELCGEGPPWRDTGVLHAVLSAVDWLKTSAATGNAFAEQARGHYRSLVTSFSSETSFDKEFGIKPTDPRELAAILLVASCEVLTGGEDPAKLPWHVKNKLAGLATLVPDFPEGRALLERMKSAEASSKR